MSYGDSALPLMERLTLYFFFKIFLNGRECFHGWHCCIVFPPNIGRWNLGGFWRKLMVITPNPSIFLSFYKSTREFFPNFRSFSGAFSRGGLVDIPSKWFPLYIVNIPIWGSKSCKTIVLWKVSATFRQDDTFAGFCTQASKMFVYN